MPRPGIATSTEHARMWRRSTRCAGNGCVEVALSSGEIAVRDSKRPDGPILTYTRSEWDQFIGSVKAGEFDLA
jgi:hypothetical protein